jgi:poly-beta-hydroxyalkanoate depolymerase
MADFVHLDINANENGLVPEWIRNGLVDIDTGLFGLQLFIPFVVDMVRQVSKQTKVAQ